MKRLILIGGLLSSIYCIGQVNFNGEFQVHSNGLIYAPEDMAKLGKMVDSLNLKFKSCELTRNYVSHEQGNVWYVSFISEVNDLKMIKGDIEAGKSFQAIAREYAEFVKSKDSTGLLVKMKLDKGKPYFLVGCPGRGYNDGHNILPGAFTGKSKWSLLYEPKSNYFKYNELHCYYLPEPMTTKVIPPAYAMLIQYVDCMMDTSASVVLGEGKWQRGASLDGLTENINTYVTQKMGLKKKNDKNAYKYFTEEKLDYAINKLGNDAEFIDMVKSAIDENIESGTGNWQLEQLAAAFIGKDKALEMKRHRRVVGGCSQDQGPRIHAQEIAILSAQTHKWDIFLRAHMDIMNDRFERMSDGSYAYAGRLTYLKELEDLGLNVTDLMIGLSLRSASVARGHYHGTVWRLGRAMADSKDKEGFEMRVQQMLKDDALDEFNRGLLFILYSSYINHLRTDEERQTRIRNLQTNLSEYPAILHPAINELKAKRTGH